jgi:DNA-binding NarL/FixJ family response regulator
VSGVDLSHLIPEIPTLIEELEELLADHRILLCLEHRQWLAACMTITPVHKSLVGAVTTEDEAFELVRKHRPTLLMVSQHLQQGTGLSLVVRTVAFNRNIKKLLVADDSEDDLVREALARGCDGICFESERFMPALRVVAGGGVYYPQAVAAVLRQKAPPPLVEPLTEREREVLNHLMLGLTDQQISKQLVVSPETVKSHVKHIYQKLGVDNRTKAVVTSIAAGLISLESALEGKSLVSG